jgi:hypothetical protein
MTYIVELSIRPVNFKNMTTTKDIIINNAYKKECNFFYEDSEYTKMKGKYESLVLLNFTFLTEKNIVSFVRFIKEEYKKKVTIECVTYEGNQNIIIYANRRYLLNTGKYNLNKYKLNKKLDLLKEYAPLLTTVL